MRTNYVKVTLIKIHAQFAPVKPLIKAIKSSIILTEIRRDHPYNESPCIQKEGGKARNIQIWQVMASRRSKKLAHFGLK